MFENKLASHAARLTRGHTIEAPNVETVNQQVRTSMSVPFQRHMLGEALISGKTVEAPAVETVNHRFAPA